MGVEKILEDAREAVKKTIPTNIEVTEIDFEGPIIVIYTKNLDEFAKNNDLVRQLAQSLRRRVAIRPDPSMLADPISAEERIRKIIPEEAKITNAYFEDDTGEVTIEAISPGLVIGKHGAILNEIKKEIGWAPKVVRAPPIPSKTVSEIRNYLRKVQDERKEFLRRVGRRLMRQRLNGEAYLRVTALGGYREVGRSATLLSTRESKILIDCGVSVSADDNGSTPYLSAPELFPLDTLDAVVVTHAHLDHSGLVPVLYKYEYEGPIYCTPPTRDLMSLLQLDFIKVAVGEGKKAPYESSHIRDAVVHCIPLKYGETTDISPDVRLTLQNAGHILGSSIAHFHVGDGMYNIAFSGDIKFEKSWLFNASVNKFPRLETLVMESTYGGYHDMQPSRQDAANQIREVVRTTLGRGGKVLIPVFAVGRSQEVMLVLEELMRNHHIHTVPIYLDGMIWEATAIHTAYPEYLNSQLRTQIFQMGENPFLSPIFKRIDSPDMRERICHDPESCIVLATSGMMNGGPVMEYFKAWCDDPNNTIVFVGFQADGTMGRKIQKGWSDITLNERGKQISLKMEMDSETADGFSGHSDRRQLVNYVSTLEPRPERIIIGHGEDHKCSDLASTLYKKFGIETRAPLNLETIRLK
ncbi:MAG: beta-CASP ribonuclease aCPSF1 [Methanobacteriota archaeon]|nr:MAG: beta-CASP ribonuclease aCPSF1 [Euryarchaeota archaeon]